MIYLLDKSTGKVLKTEKYEVIPNTIMEAFFNTYGEDIQRGYGTYEISGNIPIYKPVKVLVRVDQKDNIYRYTNLLTDFKNEFEMDLKKLIEIERAKLDGKIVKYIRGEFREFTPKVYEEYDDVIQDYTLNLDKYKEYIKDIVSKCEHEVRDHGFYYTFWDNELYLQPFRVSGDNDYAAVQGIMGLENPNHRILKLFVAKNGKRVTKVGAYKILRGTAVIDPLLTYLRDSIVGYSGLIKDAISLLVKYVDTQNTKEQLDYILNNYVEILISNITARLDKEPGVKQLKANLTKVIKDAKIKPESSMILK